MKKVLVFFAGFILSVQMTQAKESGINSIFEEPGKQGVLKQLTAISTAEQSSNSPPKKETAANCPGLDEPGPLTKELLATRRLSYKTGHDLEINSTETRSQFAYDLHLFAKSKGRDYDSILNSSFRSALGTKNTNPAYLPYREQEDFANAWWTKKSKKYRESDASEKKLFLHEAIVDATNLYGKYGQRVYGTAAYVAWEEAAMKAVLKKQ